MCATDEESVRVVSSTLHSPLIQPRQVNKFFGGFTVLPSDGVSSVKRGFPQFLRLSKNLMCLRFMTSSTPGSCSSLILQFFILK